MTEIVECIECGERYKGKLLVHPITSGDHICVDCLIDWHEEQIDSHEVDLRALYKLAASLRTLDKKKSTHKERQ